ncbi:MAG: ThiF family adenylyltransferase [Bacilli bacterium]
MFDRTIALIGKDNLDKIKNSSILIIGVGGVGGYAIEALIRSGIENITLVDYDKIDISNINRQIIAKESNIGKSKVEEWKKRILEINNNVNVTIIKEKITKDNINILFNKKYDYIIDACDTVVVKKILIKKCKEKNIKLLTICGMGKKINPSLVKICDIKDTEYDPIAKELRKYIKDNHIKGKIPCIFSNEKPITNDKKIIASMTPVPAVAGIYAAYYIINNIIQEK